MDIQVNLELLDTTLAFPYLVCTVAFNNSDWKYMYRNMRKVQRRWGVVAKVITKTVETVWAWAMMYKAVFHMLLICGSDSWLVMDAILKVLEGLHYWVARRISWMSDQ